MPAKADNQSPNNELFGAIRKGDTASVKKLLDSGASANAKDADGDTALIYAALDANASP